MQRGGVSEALRAALDAALEGAGHPDELATACEGLQWLVHKAGVLQEIQAAVLDAYDSLGPEVRVAVRSSATSEDAAGTSFAGMNATFTNVAKDQVIERLRDCWASLFTPRVVVYRSSRQIDEEPAIAVVIQRMVDSQRSGVAFTADPSTGNRERIVIEAAFGLGEVVVSGAVEPDTYVLAKAGPRILETRIGHQTHKIICGPSGADLRVELDPQTSGERVLTDDEAIGLGRLALRVEQHYKAPQDLEWAIAEGRTWLVQSRPITTLEDSPGEAPGETQGTVLITGLAASPGTATGRVRVLSAPSEDERFSDGEVLVATMTNPDWVPTMRRAAALAFPYGELTDPESWEGDAGELLVLATSSDDRMSQLRAGESLSAVLLAATELHLASCPLTQPVEVDTTRAVLRDRVLDGAVCPQTVLRVGWAPVGNEPLPATPRRPLDDVVARFPNWPGEGGPSAQ